MTEIIGSVAAILTTSAFLPQAWKTIKTKNTSGISLAMYCLLLCGVILWFIYGLLLDSKPIIYANAITASFSAIILYYKVKNTMIENER